MLKTPGQMTVPELDELRKVCTRVGPGGYAVEIGSLYGLSSNAIAAAIPRDATLFCIDPWVREQWIVDLVEAKNENCPLFSKDAFLRFTSSHLNIVPLEGYSPRDFGSWALPVDLVFEDSIHQNPILASNLLHWLKQLKDGGILCGHDYSDQWPDVIREVDRISRQRGAELHVVDSFWWMQV
ncbi:MAG: class I SAM-dependent methyltransferase [Aestuariivirga sp.]|uniref:class I SAM-dependent methyltransferase n=1 Tax=Aestuariivirga sp. TaxID=2650926 RepID=UPI0025BCEEA8|nr:class I SAM-dependent methyltransferase [Aestuariivirga sp.]MCA3562476.1 class I SAM-dependent methyltransferase [Aestuariivirga sp.]